MSSKAHFDSVANIIYKNNFQMCTHAIGDSEQSGYSIFMPNIQSKNNRRWRIEHAQVVDGGDFHLFGDNSCYHLRSLPMRHRICIGQENDWEKARLKNAYAYRQLMQQNGWLPLGTDFPVRGYLAL